MHLPGPVAPLLVNSAVATAAIATPSYRPGHANSCPDCGQSQWLVGRVAAECAHCDTVLPLAPGRHGFTVLGR